MEILAKLSCSASERRTQHHRILAPQRSRFTTRTLIVKG